MNYRTCTLKSMIFATRLSLPGNRYSISYLQNTLYKATLQYHSITIVGDKGRSGKTFYTLYSWDFIKVSRVGMERTE